MQATAKKGGGFSWVQRSCCFGSLWFTDARRYDGADKEAKESEFTTEEVTGDQRLQGEDCHEVLVGGRREGEAGA